MAMCVMAVVGAGAMPVLLAGREPDHITGPDLLDRSPFALSPAAAGRDDEGLTQRMGMPCSSRAGLESDAGALPRVPDRAPETSGSMRTVPVNHSAGPLPEGCEPILLMSILKFFHCFLFGSIC